MYASRVPSSSALDSKGARARQSGSGAPERPPAKRRRFAANEGWLSANGTLNFGATHDDGQLAWSTEDVWNAVLGSEEVKVEVPGRVEEPWASLAVAALRRSGPMILPSGPSSGSRNATEL